VLRGFSFPNPEQLVGIGLVSPRGRLRRAAEFPLQANTRDPTIDTAVTTLLTAVAPLSCFVPARRTTRVNPIVALRAD
jgi:ABC-type lipoprotein release transport system permease subunit